MSFDIKKRLTTIDVLRGIAILMVIAVHSIQVHPTQLNQTLVHIAIFGQMGAQLFFMLSGFSLSLSWDKSHDKNTNGFYKKRLISIVPAYWITIIFYAVFSWMVHGPMGVVTTYNQAPPPPLCIASGLTLINGIMPNCFNPFSGGWFIGTTVIFYLLFPLLFGFMEWSARKARALPFIIPVLATGVSVLLQWLAAQHYQDPLISANNGFVYFSFVNQMPTFLLGIALYYAYKSGWFKRMNLAAVGIFSALIIYMSFVLLIRNIPILFAIIPFTATLGFAGIFVGLEASGIMSKFKRLETLLSKFGKISLAIFLTHFLTAWYLQDFVTRIIRHYVPNISATVLYLVILIPLVVCIYYIGLIASKAITAINNRVTRFID